MIRLLLITLLATSAWAQTGVTVTHQDITPGSGTAPDTNGYLSEAFDELSGNLIHYGVRGNNGGSIYSNTIWGYNPVTHVWTMGPSTGATVNQCSVDTATMPSERHPIFELTVDTRRHRMIQTARINGACNLGLVDRVGSNVTRLASLAYPFVTSNSSWVGATILIDGTPFVVASVTDADHLVLSGSPGGSQSSKGMTINPVAPDTHDMYYLDLSGGTVASWQWHRMTTPATFPNSVYTDGAMAYDPDVDAYITYGSNSGFPQTAIYCPTDLNPVPGTLTPAQARAGGVADDWVAISTTGTPTGISSPQIVYSTGAHRILQYAGFFGGGNGTPNNELWSYEVQAKTWTKRCTSCVDDVTQPPVWSDDPNVGARSWAGLAYDRNGDRLYYLQTTNPSAPKIWSYSYIADVWTSLTYSGDSMVTYNPTATFATNTNEILAWSLDAGVSGHPFLYTGTVTPVRASLRVPLTIQEALYSAGPAGVARYDEPFSLGVPIADASAITDTSLLNLEGATAGQFRVLECWSGVPTGTPATSCSSSGHIKYLKVDGILASLAAGGTATVTLTNGGAGNFGGSNIASGTTTITLATGAMTATVKCANFNVLDTVSVGATAVVTTSSSATRGLVLIGPDPAAVTAMTGTIAEPYTISGSNNTLGLSGQGAAATTVTLTSGSGITAATIASAINTAAPSGLTASAVSGHVVLTSSTSGPTSKITLAWVCGASHAYATLGFDTPSASCATPNGTPYLAAATCSPSTGGSSCATVYSSANDSSSTCSIEENGPVMSTVRAIGTHKDASGNPYMQFTAREKFYKGKTSVDVTSVLRNANYATGATPSVDMAGTFTTAFKGIKSYELRLGASITGTLNYTLSTDGTDQTGTVSTTAGTDAAWVYQAQNSVVDTDQCNAGTGCAALLTPDTGWIAKKNSTTLSSSTNVIKGYADILCVTANGCTGTNGVGVQTAVWQPGGYWPESLEFAAGGADVRIGLYSARNSVNVYQAWPTWDVKKSWLNFHSAAVSSLANAAQSFQAPLIGRATVAHYNSTNVFLIPMPDPTQEDAFYTAVAGAVDPVDALVASGKFCCIADYARPGASRLGHDYASGAGAGGQEEFRLNDLQIWLRRGFTGRYLNSMNFYQGYQSGYIWPMSDGTSTSDATVNNFKWSSRPQYGQTNQELNGSSQPNAARANSTLSFAGQSRFINADNYNHSHWHGIIDGYRITGDETLKEAMMAFKASFLTTFSYPGYGNQMATSRGYGLQLLNSAKFSEFLTGIGDSDATNVLAQGVGNFTGAVKPDLCVQDGSGNLYPAGCSLPPFSSYGSPADVAGTSRVWGVHFGENNRTDGSKCAAAGTFRYQSTFLNAILVEGVEWIARVKGPSWSDYNTARDLSYGVSQFIVNGAFQDNGSSKWKETSYTNPDGVTGWRYNGIPYMIYLDDNQHCPPGVTVNDVVHFGKGFTWDSGTTVYDGGSPIYGMQATFTPWWVIQQRNGALTASELRKLNLAMANAAVPSSTLSDTKDFGGYQIGGVIQRIYAPTGKTLQDQSFSFSDLGSGTYRLTFTAPGSATATRVKYSTTKQIIGWLGYDHFAGTFANSPSTYAPWFAATACNGTNCTDPTPTGSSQSVDVATGQTGLIASNFSLKVMADAACNITPTVLGPWTVGQVISQTFTQSNCGASSWSSSGTWPTGLTFNTSPGTLTGTISGSPGTFTPHAIYDTANNAYSIVVAAAPVITTGCPLTGGTVGAAYSQSLTASPTGTTPDTWTVSAGALPGGLSLSSGGNISGTPTTAQTVTPTFKVTDANGIFDTEASCSMTISASSGPAITTMSPLPNGNQGSAYSQTISVSGGTGPYTCAVTSGTLSGSGLTLNSNCTITGTAATPAMYSFSVTPTDSLAAAGSPVAFTLTVNSITSGFMVSSFTPGSVRNNFGDKVGIRVQVGGSDVVASRIGRYCLSGNSGSHAISIVRTDQSVLATVTVSMSGCTPGAFVYGSISAATLVAGTTYYVVSLEANGGDTWYDDNSSGTTVSAVSILSSVYFDTGVYQNGVTGANHLFGPVDLDFSAAATVNSSRKSGPARMCGACR